MLRPIKRRNGSIFHALSGILSSVAVLLATCSIVVSSPEAAYSLESGAPRIFHIMSYHLPWVWNEDQLNGFKHGLNLPEANFKIFQMDSKRNSSEQYTQSMGIKARSLIDAWKPDLVYTNDDIAQANVTKYYINQSIPFVFSGVNAAPSEYGFTDAKNITGVLEQEHFVATINLLRKLVPTARKIAIIVDDGPTWPGVVNRMQSQLKLLPGIDLMDMEVVKTFSGFKSLMADLQGRADAVAMLGIFTFKDDTGSNVPFTEVLNTH